MSSKGVMERLRGLVVCGASAATADDVLAEFLSSATKLEELCLVNCALENTVTALMEAVKNTEMKRLGLERSDLGIGSSNSASEGLTTSFCEALKVNKFLTSLNLSNTNLDTTFVVALIDALLESDTKLLPEDLGEDAEEVLGWSLEGRLDKAAFVSGGDRDDSNASLIDDETVGDDDDATPSPDASESDAGEDDADDKDSGDEEADGDAEDEEGSEEEEEEEEEEEAAHEAKARRLRERQEKEEWQLQQKRIRHELKVLLQSELWERSDLAHEYYQGLQDIVAINSAPIANRRAAERQQKKEAYCSRRSGWSRLETLILRGNQVGDRGCKKLACLLRDEVPLSEEEVVQRQEAIDAMRGSFGERLGAARSVVERGEKRAWRELLRKAQRESPDFAIERRTSISAALSDLDEEDEYAKEAPPVLLTNVERSPSSSSVEESPASDGDGDTEASSGFNPEEQREWQEWVAQALPHMPVALTKKGMNTIRAIDLGSCGISRKGVQTLAEVLKTNKVLETLCLRHNPIGSSAPAKKHAQPEDGLTIFPEFAEFAEMLSVNGAVCHLDMGYCHLSPDDVRAVAEALRHNTSMVTLSLEGNQLGVDEGYQQQTYAHSYIYELWMTAARPGSALRNLNMDHNHIATCLWQEEVAALAALCGQLTSLSLSHVGLRLRHLEAWSEALLPEDPSYSPTVRVLHLAHNELATEADGAALGLLLRHFTALEELSVEEHPLLGSSGVAAALEYLPATMRRLNCTATGLTTPCVGAAQNPVLPVAVVKQLTCLLLGDVEAPTVMALGEWVTFMKRAAPRQLQFLSLWARGMVGREADVMPLQLELAQTCPSLLHMDSGFQPEFHASTFASNCFEQMEQLLFLRRMRCAAEQSKV
ncbi:conserved hypothetical protein [Leishmania major strain Friedlin]|uniref:Leucine-rich repeat protein n=1 Tax=Leishmania major TaxID=5664 RepID=Q4Q5N8_LEIMA|nr:conserved hypothetical protein [Leishmania major strain Friedlin]CAG9580009.1 Leucine_Rich_repeat_-_putative [Leishmania major strain Friedlin]CAJ08527.1 conserved hypothetical protein [Leishmania major strain Friedlin]|eukprot:XP_001685360.1 conserved hypothetical protein [Leishmania major strain Friedlin]